MEIQKTVVSLESFVGTFTAQAQPESAIPLPEGVRAERVLSCTPEARVSETLCTKDGVQITGMLLLRLCVAAEEDAPHAFEASASFTHEIKAPGVLPDMTARASACVPSCTCRVEEGGLRMQATVLLRADVFDLIHEPCVTGIDDANGLETQGETVLLRRRVLLGAHAVRLRETVDAPEGMLLLETRGTAEVGRVVSGGDGLLLDGTLTADALFFDGESVTRKSYALPFTDNVDAEPNQAPFAAVEVTQLSAEYDAGGELRLEAVLSLGLYGANAETVSLLSDAYDRDGSFSCETKPVSYLSYVGERSRAATLREPIALPGHLKDVTRVLYTTAVPAITGTEIGRADASIDGLLLLSIVYRGDDGRLAGFKTDLPFSLKLDTEGTLLLPFVKVRSVETVGSGRTLSCMAELCYGGEWYAEERMHLTADLRPGAPRDPHEGILLYFPDAGETVFDVGKRFGVPTAEIREKNPGLTEPFADGAAVLLMRGKAK